MSDDHFQDEIEDAVSILGPNRSLDDFDDGVELPDLAGGQRSFAQRWSEGELPPWTEPPTGEVPKISADGSFGVSHESDAPSGPTWKTEAHEWEDDNLADQLVNESGGWSDRGDEDLLGDYDDRGADPYYRDDYEDSDLEDQGFAVEAPPAVRTRPRPAANSSRQRLSSRPAVTAGSAPIELGSGAGRDRDLGLAAISGAVLGIGFIVLSFIGGKVVLPVIMVAAGWCLVELLGTMGRRGLRPYKLLVLVGSLATVAAVYWRGPAAIAITVPIFMAATALSGLFSGSARNATVNMGATVLAYLYIGVSASYAAAWLVIADGPKRLLTVVLLAVVGDIVAYFAGSQMGRTPLMSWVSPGKTFEGAGFGAFAVLVTGAVVAPLLVDGWKLGDGLLLGALVAVVGHLGDLFESLLKRDLGVKDMGSAMVGHGGLLDRLDAILFVIPLAYFWMNIIL